MKVGYPDTMNSAAAVSPLKARYTSSGELDDLQAVEVKKGAFAKKDDSPAEYRDISAEFRADMKAISEKYNKTEPQSSSKPTSTTTKKKGILAKRKERRAERNPKVAERQKGRAERRELRKDIKTEKARVTTARQERKTSKTTDRLARVKKKVDGKVADVKSGGLGIDQARRNKRKTIAANKVAQEAYNKKKAENKSNSPVKARSRKSGDINYKKADRLNKRVDRLDKKLKKSGVKKTEGGHYTGNPGYTGDSRREIRLRKQDRKAGAAAGYGNMDEAKSTAKLDKTLAKKGYKRTPARPKTLNKKSSGFIDYGRDLELIKRISKGPDKNKKKKK
jgi:hypothetical protein